MKTTKQVLLEMFTESTGRALMDSGDAYGRNWERNQSAVAEHGAEVFTSRPDVRFHTWNDKFDYVSINTFNWLLSTVEYAPDVQQHFDEFVENSDNSHWLSDMEEFLESNFDFIETRVVNTYNYDNNLDETLQWVEWSDGFERFVLLQYHGGADIRGGYTKPRAFRVLDTDYFGDDAAEIWCDNHGMETDLEGVDRPVCGLQGTLYSGSGIEWYSTRYESDVDVDVDELVAVDEGVVQCPSCKSGSLVGGLREW